jgi:hypothetical protein
VRLATWPGHRPLAAGKNLGVIADTRVITMPEFVLSSLNVLWESIAREIAADPFVVGSDVEEYLTRWQKGVGIADEAIDRGLFIERLIRPAYVQGVVRGLLSGGAGGTGGAEVTLYGRGWGEIEEFAARSAGEIASRAALEQAVEACAMLAHVWPEAGRHPLEAMGRPVLRCGKKLKEGAGRSDGDVELSGAVLRAMV